MAYRVAYSVWPITAYSVWPITHSVRCMVDGGWRMFVGGCYIDGRLESGSSTSKAPAGPTTRLRCGAVSQSLESLDRRRTV